MGRVKSIEARFANFVSFAGDDDCWLWTGGGTSEGYGHIRTVDGWKMAHRISYEIFNGPIPDGMFVMHKCDNPRCVNPNHLSVGTPKDNTHDAMRKGRLAKGPRGRYIPKPTQRQFTDDDIREIRRRAADTTIRQIAREFTVNKSTIVSILSGKNYKDVV